jgi:predicted transposase YdaD
VDLAAVKDYAVIKEAYEALAHTQFSNEELLEYHRYDMKESEIATRLDDAEERGKAEGIAIGEERGKAEGIAIGEERGKAEGIAIGEERGKTEGAHEQAISAATSMIADGLPSATISKYTGLSIEEIDALRQ